MLALLVWPLGAIVNRVVGPNNTEITHGSAVGGFQVFLRGKDLGTGFNPPTILIGSSGLSTCSVHPTSHGGVTRLKGFTSSSTMMKYVAAAPAPAPASAPAPAPASHPAAAAAAAAAVTPAAAAAPDSAHASAVAGAWWTPLTCRRRPMRTMRRVAF